MTFTSPDGRKHITSVFETRPFNSEDFVKSYSSWDEFTPDGSEFEKQYIFNGNDSYYSIIKKFQFKIKPDILTPNEPTGLERKIICKISVDGVRYIGLDDLAINQSFGAIDTYILVKDNGKAIFDFYLQKDYFAIGSYNVDVFTELTVHGIYIPKTKIDYVFSIGSDK